LKVLRTRVGDFGNSTAVNFYRQDYDGDVFAAKKQALSQNSGFKFM